MSRFNPYLLWAVLALPPALWSYEAMTADNARIIHILVHPTGEWAARLLIITMMATPLMMLFKGWRGPQWLKKNRRYFGVAAFGYAALHTLFYVMDKGSLDSVIGEIDRFYIWTGWVAFAIFVPLAVTSMDYFVRIMGPRWKTLQRWTYGAAVLTLLHWASLHNWGHPLGALIQFSPLIALETYRIWYWTNKRRMRRAAA
ncbi:sulfite oxidase heme-binding subunit YedZ [Primorskyibacter sp. 2E233]|uniref:sulfite oxidase heme-binding subunit YedZ n=1 Tax=Primorskyibacter sp. 2E233 TaxID=3413431 RepID=UPI003BF2AAC0